MLGSGWKNRASRPRRCRARARGGQSQAVRRPLRRLSVVQIAKDDYDDAFLRAITRGASYAFHVPLAHEKDGAWRFPVPIEHSKLIILGVVREGFSLRIVELLEEQGARGGGKTARVALTDEQVEALKLESSAERL
jgi:hypothetical protein